jgi:hypothetical protein
MAGVVVPAATKPASCHSEDPAAHLSLRGVVTFTLIVVVPGGSPRCGWSSVFHVMVAL